MNCIFVDMVQSHYGMIKIEELSPFILLSFISYVEGAPVSQNHQVVDAQTVLEEIHFRELLCNFLTKNQFV